MRRFRLIRRMTAAMRSKLGFVFVIILAFFSILAFRLFYINLKYGDNYKTKVLSSQKNSSTDIPFERGKIYDRNGNVLAMNEKIYALILEPKNILDKKGKYKDITIQTIMQYFPDIDEADLRSKIESNKDSYYLKYKEELTYEEVEGLTRFLEYANKKTRDASSEAEEEKILRAKKVRGVTFEESYRRVYPYDSLACRVLGFTSAGNVGNWGIEQSYNDVLNGVDGRAYYYFDQELVLEESVKPAKNGSSVVSTVDMKIQQAVEKNLAIYDDRIGSEMTSVLVMDPTNGEILAMASSNPYNLNDPSSRDNLKKLFSEKRIKKMEENTKKLNAPEESTEEEKEKKTTEAKKKQKKAEKKTEKKEAAEKKTDKKNTDKKKEDKKKTKKKKAAESVEDEKRTIYEGLYELWRNPIISDTNEPGSTFKPFTVAAGLESAVLKGNETYYCSGSRPVGRRNIGCSHVHGSISLMQAVSESCNVAMMNIAFSEGADTFYSYQNQFGFGRRTGVDLPGEAETSSLVYNAENYSNDATLATNAFGQNFNCTMLQMATAFCSLINGGYYYKPHIVKEIIDENGDLVESIDKEVIRETVSEDTSDNLRRYLKETVVSGTGTKGAIAGYTIGGKTGTAEKIPRNKEDYYISFIGFTPVKDPELLIYVTIDEPHVDYQANAGLAVDLEKACMEDIIEILGMNPDDKSKSSGSSGASDRKTIYDGN